MSNHFKVHSNGETKYCQILKVKTVDLAAGKLIAVLNHKDARELGIFPMDRIVLTNPKNNRSINAVVDVTDTIIGENTIGIFKDIQETLVTTDGDGLEVCPAGKPKSVEFVKKKMDGEKLSFAEVKQIVEDIASNSISEIEAAAFVSAVYIHGLDLDETVSMTKALIENGKRLDLSSRVVVDKHSVGGTNGRATMIIVPIIAAAGYAMPKTSSRAITSSSGTADAMEVLANVSLSLSEIKKVVEKTGACIVWGGAVELAPADDKIIKIEHPLSLDPEGQVIASVMAKKASVGAKYVVIDLPIGPYVKIKSKQKGEEMALKFVEVGKRMGMRVEVLLTEGGEPSGRAFGPALEARYAMEILEGKFFDNLAQKSVELAGALFELTGETPRGRGYDKAMEILGSGKALEKMKEIIREQKGSVFSSTQIQAAPFKKEVLSQSSGVVSVINVNLLNQIARLAGAPANPKAGLMLKVEPGQKIVKGETLFEIHAENEGKLGAAHHFASSKQVVEFERIIIEKFG